MSRLKFKRTNNLIIGDRGAGGDTIDFVDIRSDAGDMSDCVRLFDLPLSEAFGGSLRSIGLIRLLSLSLAILAIVVSMVRGSSLIVGVGGGELRESKNQSIKYAKLKCQIIYTYFLLYS